MKYFKYLVLLVVLISACNSKQKELITTKKPQQLPYFIEASFTPYWLDQKSLAGKHRIPQFSFLNQEGDTITNKTVDGKIYIADFFFTTCPGICPKLTKNMKMLQEEYRTEKDILLLSHTVMPWQDSVATLKEYATRHEVNSSKWHLLTGNKDEIYNVARNGYFADDEYNTTQNENSFIHTENFVLVDAEGYIRGVYNGTVILDVKRLIRHVALLKKEMSS